MSRLGATWIYIHKRWGILFRNLTHTRWTDEKVIDVFFWFIANGADAWGVGVGVRNLYQW